MKDQPQERIRFGRATVSWGPRHFGGARIVANAPADAWDDLATAVEMARVAAGGK